MQCVRSEKSVPQNLDGPRRVLEVGGDIEKRIEKRTVSSAKES